MNSTLLTLNKKEIILATGEAVPINEFLKYKYKLTLGMELSEDVLENIKYDYFLEKYTNKLSKTAMTEFELTGKLSNDGIRDETVEKIIFRIKELELIDDLKYAKNYIESKGFGKNKIEYELTQRGIDLSVIREAFGENAKEYEQKRLSEEIKANLGKSRKKLLSYLLRKGFDYESIVEELGEEDEYQTDI